MTINAIGSTAFMIAGIRALEDTRDVPLFSDPYASLFVDNEWIERTQKLTDVHFAVSEAIRLRTIVLHKIVEDEIARGIRQIVILGCGFDMRQAIYASDGVRFFDVDQPAVLEFKAGVLKKAGVPICSAVPCNYLDDDLPERLQEAGLDLGARTLFVWEGNTMYLPGEHVFDFLEQLCNRMTRFRIGFDYLLKSVIDGTYEDAEAVEVIRGVQEALGARFQTGFDSLKPFEIDMPLKVIESGNILEAGIRYAGSDTDERLASTLGLSKAFAGVYRFALIERRPAPA